MRTEGPGIRPVFLYVRLAWQELAVHAGMKKPGDCPALYCRRKCQPRWRLGRTSLSLACMLRTAFSVVSQSMQASVMDTPY